jgi:hypothetical protein
VSRITLWDTALTEKQMALECDCTLPQKSTPCKYTIAFTPADIGNAYSSTWNNDPKGQGHGRGRLNSAQAWSAARNVVGEWMQIDIGEVLSVSGIVTQGRRQFDQWVTSYQVQVDSAWEVACNVLPSPLTRVVWAPGERRRQRLEAHPLRPRLRREFRHQHQSQELL